MELIKQTVGEKSKLYLVHGVAININIINSRINISSILSRIAGKGSPLEDKGVNN